MRFFADLHVHSRFSRACSSQINIDNLEKWARVKGVNLLGTGDFTHPEWFKELKSKLSDDGSGILRTVNGFPFLLQSEISLVYTQGDKGRRIHHVILAPSFDVVAQITDYLKSKGRVDYDGRPIFNISSSDLVYNLKKISSDIEVIPAHIWTPWFGLFGSKSGFDSIKDCFGDQLKHVHSLETGLSSDPPMNWRLKQLNNFFMVSFSDLHSFWPWRIGREATIFDFKDLSYKNVLGALRKGVGLAGTVEVDPSYGKYHFDGHRSCGVNVDPMTAMKYNNICPVCKKELTLGVAHRVEALADQNFDFRPENARPFHSLLPLSELISSVSGSAVNSKSVWSVYNKLVKLFGSEFRVLLDVPEENIFEVAGFKLGRVIMANRSGKLNVQPGYDGVYGELLLDNSEKADEPIIPAVKQKGLGDFF